MKFNQKVEVVRYNRDRYNWVWLYFKSMFLKKVCGRPSKVRFTDIDFWGEMIIFKLFLTTFKTTLLFVA